MYSRSYYPNDTDFKVPDNYDGTSLLEETKSEHLPRFNAIRPDTPKRDFKEEITPEEPEPNERKTCEAEERGGILSRLLPFGFDLDFKHILSDLSGEDLLIAALAVFLFISSEGDRICSLILLSLIFIK